MLSPRTKYATVMALYGVNVILFTWLIWGHQHGQRVEREHGWVYPVIFACAVGIAWYHASPKPGR